MLPRQGKMVENTPFTRKCTSEPSRVNETAFQSKIYVFKTQTFWFLDDILKLHQLVQFLG